MTYRDLMAGDKVAAKNDKGHTVIGTVVTTLDSSVVLYVGGERLICNDHNFAYVLARDCLGSGQLDVPDHSWQAGHEPEAS